MIYFVFAFTIWLKEPLTWLKETVHKAWFPGMGKSSILLGCYGAHTDQSWRCGYFYIGKFVAHFLKCVCFENFCSGFWGRPTKRQRKMILSEECIVCGAMFGEERVNNSVDLLSRVLVAFSVGQISALVTVTHFYCNLLLQMLECYWSCSHARLACFLFETNQHFVGSARIAGLCLTDEVELEQSWQEGRLVWSVKIRRVRLTRCVFRYGPRDGMTYSAVKPID